MQHDPVFAAANNAQQILNDIKAYEELDIAAQYDSWNRQDAASLSYNARARLSIGRRAHPTDELRTDLASGIQLRLHSRVRGKYEVFVTFSQESFDSMKNLQLRVDSTIDWRVLYAASQGVTGKQSLCIY